MFSKALSSFTSNISSNYTLSPHPTTTSGPWNIFDAKRKGPSAKPVSVFVFSPKSLEPGHGGGHGGALSGARGNAASLKRAQDEVVERLRREAGSLARLRHPSILELQEPVEETRNGGLMFATEPVTASLASLLAEKGGREMDELELQKGLLQLGKGLEFLHESAGLVHANLTPEAVLINAKGDWKIAGLSFCGPHEGTTAATSLPPISLSEVLNQDPRLPRSVQIHLDYTSPDFVLDAHLTPSADMYSLGLLITALHNHPTRTSPLRTNNSLATYKRLFASPSTTPSASNNFLIPSSHPLPSNLSTDLLPRLLARRPTGRLNARDFQQHAYFDNLLVSTLRFLDALPAKSAQEKQAFLRGLPRILPQFPEKVLVQKVLPALLEEVKDRDLLALVLRCVFAVVKVLQAMGKGDGQGKGTGTGGRDGHVFEGLVVSKLREVFLPPPTPLSRPPAAATTAAAEKDAGKEAGLMVLLESMPIATSHCSGKVFHDDLLPIVLLALESSTHGLVDAALGTLSVVLPVLDFSTIKNELFPVIAGVFARTSSLAIKIRGLEALGTLCGGGGSFDISADGEEEDSRDDLDGLGPSDKKASATGSSVILDKFTVQEKVVPLLKGIKTKEPGVMMAALRVFRRVGEIADSEFLAMEVLPVLWSMALGPLLDLRQFQAFMNLIKKLGGRIEGERTRQLQELSRGSGVAGVTARGGQRAQGSVGNGVVAVNGLTNGEETDFETLVSGRKAVVNGGGDLMNDWGAPVSASTSVRTSAASTPQPAAFSWQSTTQPSTAPLQPQQPAAMRALRPPAQQIGRTVTPDQSGSLASFAALTPASAFSQPLQPSRPTPSSITTTNTLPIRPTPQQQFGGSNGSSIDWSAATANTASAWASQRPAPPPMTNGTNGTNGFGLAPPPVSPQAIGHVSGAGGGFPGLRPQAASGQASQVRQTGGLDRYESLL